MLKRAAKWALRLAVLAMLATAVARVVARVSEGGRSGGSPVIGGDTWPPVPTNRAQDSRRRTEAQG